MTRTPNRGATRLRPIVPETVAASVGGDATPHGLPRRRFLAGLAATGAAAGVGVAQAQTQPQGTSPGQVEKEKVIIAVGGKPALYYLPLTIAEQLGYFKAAGLDVEIVDFAGGSKSLQAVVGGSADVVSGAYEHTINLAARRQYFRSFVLQGRAPQITIGIGKAKATSYRTPADLKGLKIGVSAPGSSTHLFANFLMSKGGLKASDASFIGVGTGPGALSALRSGQIDAISNIDPVMTMLEKAGDIKVLASSRTDKGTREVLGGPMPAACLYAPEAFVTKNPGTVLALTTAIVRADRWIQTAGPSDIVKTVPESYLLGDRALYLDAFANVREAFSPDGLMPEAGPKTALAMLASAEPKLAEAKIDLARTYTNDFVRRVPAARS